MMSAELPPLYYLDNLRTLVRHVLGLYADILPDDMLGRSEDFLALPDAEAALLTRLLCRKGPLFRTDRLHYPEIRALEDALTGLREKGWIGRPGPPDRDALLRLLTLPELRQRFDVPAAARTRSAVIRALSDLDARALLALSGLEVIALNTGDWLDWMRLAFFGNLYQDMTTFVTAQLGVQRYPGYRLRRATRLFNSATEMEAAMTLHRLREAVPDLPSPEALNAAVASLPPDTDHSLLQRRRRKALNALARRAEQLGDPVLAERLYRESGLPPARERLVRLAFRDGRLEEAEALLEAIAAHPASETELAFRERFLPRLLKRRGQRAEPEWQPEAPETLCLTPHPDGVEAAVCHHLATRGITAYHLENRLFNVLFRAHFHDVLFAEVRGALTHPFQMAPHDLRDPEFHARRQPQIEQAWQALSGPDWTAHLQRALSRPECAYLEDWLPEGPEVLALALSRIPAAHLALIFRRMLRDPYNNCSGLPDLILFPPGAGYTLLEVKGPGDRLQDNQWRWLRYFHQHGLPAGHVRVVWHT